ncbi:MAG: MetQ/NlpA family ABC transporter substrate-binding protein [Burkholderiaceae bacterium]
MQRRPLLRHTLQFFSGLSLLASLAIVPAQAQDKPIKIGVTGGPHAEIMEMVKKIAAKDGLNIQVVEFSDYIQPNAALAAGDLDANSFQHLPYMEAQIKDRGYKFTNIGYTITEPMGVYSKKLKSLTNLKAGARIGIPNDPTNGGRALLLLQSKGLFQLKANAGLQVTPLDIASNPKKIKIVELDAAQLPRSLQDFDAAVINGNYAQQAGLNPSTEAIAIESPKGPYANIIAVREQDKAKPWVAKLLKAYHSPEVKQFVLKQYKNSVIVSW